MAQRGLIETAHLTKPVVPLVLGDGSPRIGSIPAVDLARIEALGLERLLRRADIRAGAADATPARALHIRAVPRRLHILVVAGRLHVLSGTLSR